MTEKRKSKKEIARATLASVTKEMAQPRFTESAREEEEANHHASYRGQESSESSRRGSEVKSSESSSLLCLTFVSSIVVLTIGFLGVGVRAFESAGTTKFVFGAAFIVFAMILVLYFMLRGSTRERPAHSLFRESPFLKRSLFSRLSAWRPGIGRWVPSAGPILSRVLHKIEYGFLSRKTRMGLGERMSPEDRVARVSKPPVSRRAA
jgi:heme/copper-type cytochrome/quinol oxidase subunit 4